MNGHTKGPWRTAGGRSPAGGKYLIVENDHEDIICEVLHTHNQTVGAMEMDANAHLIAASPELLEACKGLLDMITDNRLHGDEVYRASDAIKKAEGRP